MEIAPLRLTLAFSSSSTRSFGFASLALTAAIGPAVPPPTTSDVVLHFDRVHVVLSGFGVPATAHALDAQPVLEGVAAVVEELEVERRAVAR